MSILKDIKVVESTDRTKGYDPVRVRRKKLAAALLDQLNLLEATEKGEAYRRVQIRRKRDLETDELVDVPQQRRVVPWWWVDDDGSVKFTLKYGSARLQVKDGKEVLQLPSLDKLRAILPALRQEVLSGGLDGALSTAADGLQARFKTRKRVKA